MAFLFDGLTKTISLSLGTTAMSVTDLWSRWVDWLAVGDNSKWAMAMSQVGGDVIDAVAGTSIPNYIYLMNGWKLRPQEASHTLNVSGGILLVAGGGDPFLDTLGNFVVRISYSQPVQAITVSTAGGSGASVTDIWTHVIETGYTAEQLIKIMASILAGKVSGAGTGIESFRDLADTKDRVAITVDSAGNRTQVTRDAS
jgi:hypothetical protein